MLHSFRHCLPRGSEESAGPQAPLCTRWGTWLGPLLLWAWDPTSPSLPWILALSASSRGTTPASAPPAPLPLPRAHLFYRHGLEL